MLALLMGSYYGFFLPQMINIQIEYDFLLKTYISHSLYVIYFLNALANPIIYAWMSPEFNMAFREILGFKSQNKVNIRNGRVLAYIKSPYEPPEKQVKVNYFKRNNDEINTAYPATGAS